MKLSAVEMDSGQRGCDETVRCGNGRQRGCDETVRCGNGRQRGCGTTYQYFMTQRVKK